jgi:2-isopropylmalate synthase
MTVSRVPDGDTADIHFNWNQVSAGGGERTAGEQGILFDETLRDGIQAPGVGVPALEQKLRVVDFMVGCGIGSADLGFPGSGDAAARECQEIAKYVTSRKYPLKQGYAGRMHPADVAAICDVAYSAGCRVDAYLFIGVSPIRQYVQGWDLATILVSILDSADECGRAGVEFVLVLEDASRCPPEVLTQVYRAGVDAGVRRVTLCDTVGVALPSGTEALLGWSAQYFRDREHAVSFEWHGHNDRGLAVINGLTAFSCGCERVHGTVLGIGERAGNASIDQIMVNRHLEGHGAHDLKAVRAYCEYASSVLGVDIQGNYPAMGSDVFKTSAGVHASAILKANEKHDYRLKDAVYSSIPASLLGREQEVLIDASSGTSNVRYWLSARGMEADDAVIKEILATAKGGRRPLRDSEIEEILAGS